MNDLKNKIENILRVNRINFSLEYYHKGHDIRIEGADEIEYDLESWMSEVLIEYLLSEDLWYNISGSFILKEEKLVLCMSFTGPYEDEFEPVELPLEVIFSAETVKKDLEKIILTEMDFSKLLIEFFYEEVEGFKNFNIKYLKNNKFSINLVEILPAETLSEIKKSIGQYIQDNVPYLNLPEDIKQNFYAECIDNSIIVYYISSSEMIIEWDAVEN